MSVWLFIFHCSEWTSFILPTPLIHSHLSVFHRDGRLQEQDQLLAIDGQTLDSSHADTIRILQSAQGPVEIVVARGPLPLSAGSLGPQQQQQQQYEQNQQQHQQQYQQAEPFPQTSSPRAGAVYEGSPRQDESFGTFGEDRKEEPEGINVNGHLQRHEEEEEGEEGGGDVEETDLITPSVAAFAASSPTTAASVPLSSENTGSDVHTTPDKGDMVVSYYCHLMLLAFHYRPRCS